jgi:RNA polymerase sigma-70 factor (ECF subfamily)
LSQPIAADIEAAVEAEVEAATEEGRVMPSLEEAFARWQDELLGTLYYLVGNREDARDALQETFVKCWRNRQTLGEIENLKAWIFRVALNTGRDVRASAWRRRRQSLVDEGTMLTAVERNPASDVERAEELRRVRRALRDLRPEEQEVFLLRQNGALTYEAIAEAIGIPLGTVKTRMRLAIEKLRVALA